MATRGRGAILGAALGGSIGVPAGMLQDYLVTLLPEDQQRQRQLRVQQTEAIILGEGKDGENNFYFSTLFYLAYFWCSIINFLQFLNFSTAVPLERPETPPNYDPAGAVIKQLEASLAGSPSGGGGRVDSTSKGDGSSEKGGGQRWKLWGRKPTSNTTD